MRYCLFLCLLVVTVPVLGYNEVVSAISYNPSLTGAYTHLKVVENATLKGGLAVDNSGALVNVVKNVTVTDSMHSCAQNDVSNTCSKVTTIVPSTNVTQAPYKRTAAQGGILQGPSGVLYGTSYNVASGNSQNSGLTIHMKDGTIETTGDSYIGQIQNMSGLVVSGGALRLEGDKTLWVRNVNAIKMGGVEVSVPSTNLARYKFKDRVDTAGTKFEVFSAE